MTLGELQSHVSNLIKLHGPDVRLGNSIFTILGSKFMEKDISLDYALVDDNDMVESENAIKPALLIGVSVIR
jgi:hypothetical protein